MRQELKVLMPVLHYSPVIGGLETWTKNIADGMLHLGAEVFVVTGKVENQQKEQVLNKVNIYRTSLFSLKNLSYSSFLYILTTLPFIFFKSLKTIKKEKINLLHCQGFLSSSMGFLLSKLTGIPYIITVQSIQGNKNPFKKIVYRNADNCIAVSQAIKEYFQKIGCKNIDVIPNGIFLQRFKNLNREENRKKLGLKNEFTVMTIARLEKVKGLKYLIEAISLLEIQDLKLIIIGEGSERKNLENLVEKLNLKNKVRFLGEVSNKEIPEYLAAADCFCLTSEKEGFGIAILEAQAADVPVVATNVGGIPDIIENNRNGILVKSKDSKDILRAIFKIYSDKDFTFNLKENAQKTVSWYGWDIITHKVYGKYKDVNLEYKNKKSL